jgi:hypothetical protein
MSQSQQSEALSSSIYNGDFENLAYFTPESAQSVTPNLLTSHQTFDSLNSEFIRPPPHLTVPSSLTLVGPGRRKPFVRYDQEMHTEWVNWWLETEYGKSSKIRWDSNHQTDTWQQFHQVANVSDGAPKVMCKRCGQILEHPYSLRSGSTARHGTSTMLRHIKSASCLRSSQKDPQKAALAKFIQSNVSHLLS